MQTRPFGSCKKADKTLRKDQKESTFRLPNESWFNSKNMCVFICGDWFCSVWKSDAHPHKDSAAVKGERTAGVLSWKCARYAQVLKGNNNVRKPFSMFIHRQGEDVEEMRRHWTSGMLWPHKHDAVLNINTNNLRASCSPPWVCFCSTLNCCLGAKC